MKKIETQNDLDTLTQLLVWDDAFIRECYALATGYVERESGGMVSPYNPTVKVLVCTQDDQYPGIELLFVKARDLYLPFNFDLDPKGEVTKHYILFSFIDGNSFECKELYYQIVDQSCWGRDTLRYGTEPFYTDDWVLKIP